MTSSHMTALATEIQANTTKLDKYFTDHNLQPPSFDENAPLTYQLPSDIIAAQEALSAALDELWWLNQGPVRTVMAKASATSISIKLILKYNIHQLVPMEVGTTFQDLADKTAIPIKKLARVLRHAMTDHIFHEPEPGYIKHTIASKALVEIPLLPTWCEMDMYEIEPARICAADAIAKWPTSEEPSHSGYNLAHNTDKTMFEFFGENPDRGNRFKAAMGFLQMYPGLESSHIIRGFDWASLGEATVVDVGGSHGKDLPEVVDGGKSEVPAELADRVTFMAHDFFTEQPVKGAEVYYFRWVFHDWPDKYCLKILKALVPALRPGSRIVLSEMCLEPPGISLPQQERWDRDNDMRMLATLNAQERDEIVWKELFRAADRLFTLEEIKRSNGAMLDTLIVRWG